MSDRELKIKILLAAVDRMTKPLRDAMKSNKELAAAVKNSRDALKALEATQGKLKNFQQLRERSKQATEQLHKHNDAIKAHNVRLAYSKDMQAKLAGQVKVARKSYQGLSDSMLHLQNPSPNMLKELMARKAALEKLQTQYGQSQNAHRRNNEALRNEEKALRGTREQRQQLARSLADARQKLQASGVSTRQLAQAEAELKARTEAANAALNQQQQRLEQLGKQQQRLNAARATYDRQMQTRDKVAGAGASAVGAGMAISLPIMQTLKEAKHFNTEMQRVAGLGFSKQTNKEAEEYARAMKTYGTSSTENATLVRDAMTVFADLHHAEMVAPTLAKMKFANTALYGETDGAKNEAQFINMLKVIELRGGTKSKEAFLGEANRIQQVISATGGRVGPEEWKNFIQTSGVAGKQLSSRSFYNMMEPLIQEMGGHQVGTGLMSAYSNIYQGKTTVRAAREMGRLGLIDSSKVEYDKVGQLKRIRPGALKDGETFKANPLEWLENTLLPALKAKGITDQGAINDTISSIFTNRTAANLMTTMVLQRQQIHKSAKLSEGSANIDELDILAKASTAGKEVAASKRRDDLQLAIGENVLPLYNNLLENILAVMNSTREWMAQNPRLSQTITIAAAALGVLLLVIGSLLLALAAVMGPMIMMRFGLAMIGVSATGPIGILSKLGGVISFFGSAAAGIGRILLSLGSVLLPLLSGAFTAFSAVIMATPIGWIIAGIAALVAIGLALYNYWGPISAFFSGVWEQIKAAFSGGLGGIFALVLNWSLLGAFYSAFASVMNWFGVELPATFTGYGGMIIDGLMNGLSAKWEAVKAKATEIANSISTTVKDKLGIHSPSRVFAQIGGYTMAGLEQGLSAGQASPLASIMETSKKIMAAGAGMAIGLGSGMANAIGLPPLQQNSLVNSPLRSQSPAIASPVSAGQTIIQIYQLPGQSNQDLAKEITRALDERDRKNARLNRSSLSDRS